MTWGLFRTLVEKIRSLLGLPDLKAALEHRDKELANLAGIVGNQLVTVKTLQATLEARETALSSLEQKAADLESVIENQRGTFGGLNARFEACQAELEEEKARNLQLARELAGGASGARAGAFELLNRMGPTAANSRVPDAVAAGSDEYYRGLAETNPLFRFFLGNQDKALLKHSSYFEAYHRHLEKFRGTRDLVVLEIGVQLGGSLGMWRDYFGADARIYGVDIDPQCKSHEAPGIEVLIGDQGDPEFLESVAERVGPVDVVIDDGGHFSEQQITSFLYLFPSVKNGGLYLVEDVGTSYWSEFGGAFRKRHDDGTSFVEFSKDLVDSVNRQAIDDAYAELLVANIYAVHYYEFMVMFEKREIEKAFTAFSPLESELNEAHGFGDGAARLRSILAERRGQGS